MKRILVVDDDKDIVEIFQEVIGSWGFETRSAFDGQTALQLFRSEKFDVVLSDFHMPGLDGLQFLKAAKKERPDCPVILVTGFASFSEPDALAAGADAVILKPVNFAYLKTIIDKHAAPDSESKVSTGEVINIWVADDDEAIRDVLKDSFRQFAGARHLNLTFYANGADLIAACKTSEDIPGLIINELNMADMDGFEVLESLKQLDRIKDVPKITLSSSLELADQKKVLQLGGSGFYTKPQDVRHWEHFARAMVEFWLPKVG